MIYVTHDQIEAMTLADRIAVMKDGIIQQLASPHEIYNHPVNLFVAGFIGSPTMNFFKGNIAGGDATTFVFEDIVIPLKGYKFEAEVPNSTMPAVLGIRPEHVGVGEDARAMQFSWDAEIEIVEPMGSETIAWTKLGSQAFTFRCSSEIELKAGQRILLGFDAARGSVFNAETTFRA
jgi:multiple sugar transport system ATP-binding protein